MNDKQNEWLYQLVDEFRKVVNNPPKIECLDQLLNYDLRKPIQITVLWLHSDINNLQFFLITHNSKFPDKLVSIFGPLHIYMNEFKEIDEIIEDIFKYLENNNDMESLNANLNSIIRENITILNENAKNQVIRYGLFEHHYFYFLFHGNIFQLPIIYILKVMLRHNNIHDETREIPWIYEYEVFLTGYINPPVWFGNVPNLTKKDKLVGKNLAYFVEIIYEGELSCRRLVIMNDGYIGIATKTQYGAPLEDKKLFDTSKILNLFFSVFLITDIPIQTVHASDFNENSFNVDLKILSFSSQDSINTKHFHHLRYMPIDIENFEKERKIVTIETLEEIITLASKLINDKKISSSLTILIHAYTNLTKGEFNQSFILSWTIIEQYLNSLWRSALSDKKISNRRIKKLEGRDYTASIKLELLNLLGYINSEEYITFNKLRKKRNDFMHELLLISPLLAQEVLELAKNYTKLRVGEFLKNKSVI